MKNTIVAGNTDAPDCLVSGLLSSLGHKVVGSGTCTFTGPGDQVGTTDPKLAPLANNGGPTQTNALQPGSPAIDAGDNTGCPGQDQRGFPRPRSSSGSGPAICDVGAYEVQDPFSADLSVSVTAPDSSLAGSPVTFTASVPNPADTEAPGVVLTLSVSGAVRVDTVTPSQGACTGSNQVTCTFGAVAAHGQATVAVQLTPTTDGTVTVTGSVTSSLSDPNPGNNTGSKSLVVNPSACAPRPNIAMQTTRIGPGRIQSILTVGRTSLAQGNILHQLLVVRLDNATLTVNGAAATAGQAIILPSGATQVQVVVTRVAAGAFTARLSLTDDCGAYATLVGGGVGVP